MKGKIYSILILAVCTTMQVTGYNVSTEKQNKNILLEEFTGIHCGNCPDGHEYASRMQTAQGNNINIVAIHSGNYAEPSSGRLPDFRTEEGEEFDTFFGANMTGYPCAMINRRIFEGEEYATHSRKDWFEYAKECVKEDAPVNLWAEVIYNSETSELQINVEGYWVSTLTNESSRLNIFLTQNDIKSYQNGGNMGDEYVHKHMLRDVITDKYGDEITDCKEGNYFSKEYIYIVPDAINDTEVVPNNLEVVIFVTEDEYEVLNSITAKPAIIGATLPLEAEISSYKLPVRTGYRLPFVELYFTNKSNTPITTADFQITLNGVESESVWNCSDNENKSPISHQEKRYIRIPVDWQDTATDENEFTIKLTGINGEKYDGGTISGSFTEPISATTDIVLQIKTDNFASDNTFKIFDSEYNEILQFGPYQDDIVDTYEETCKLEDNKVYCIEVADNWGDGILSPRGSVKVYDANRNLISQQLQITDHGLRIFIETSKDSSIEQINNDKLNTEIYSISGIKIASYESYTTFSTSELMPGIYIIKKSSGETKKLIVK